MFSAKCVAIFVVLLPEVIHCQNFVGDLCTLKSSGSEGKCQLISKCPSASNELRKFQRFPQTCGFEGTQPIVCCVESTPARKPGEISYKKCKEYSAFVREKKFEPVLIIDPDELDNDECGHKVVTLIIGGEPAGKKEFPHMAAVGYELTTGDINWSCGGTIISEQYVLTAGHCLYSKDFGPAKYVRLGITNLKNERSIFKQDIQVTERIPHPQYRSNSHYNDIALLKLQTPAKLNPYAVPACLYSKPNIEAEKAIATGWGTTQYAGISSEDLLKVTLDLFSQSSCNNSYKNQITRRLTRGIVEESQLCAGSLKDEEKDTCQGDSGGPLQIYHIKDNIICMYDIIGVTSFGKACSGSPGVYTRVSHFIKWIEDTVWPETP